MSQTLTAELNALTKKRETLEKLVQFAVQITRLLDSMEAVQHMSKPDEIPLQKRNDFVNAVGSRVQHLTGPELQTRLGKLDDTVKKDLIRILKIADTSESEFNRYIAPISNNSPQNSAEWLNKSVYEFKRRTQTGAALRMVLMDKGIPVPSAKLPVSPENIKQQIESLKQRESQYRFEVIHQVDDLLKDVEQFLSNPTFPDELKQHMVTLKSELCETKENLESGKSIESLPMVVQYIEIDNSDPFSLPSSGELEESTEEKQEKKAEEQQLAALSDPVKKNTSNKTEKKIEPQKIDVPIIKLSFFRKILVWLGTPWYVKWRDIEKYHSTQLAKK